MSSGSQLRDGEDLRRFLGISPPSAPTQLDLEWTRSAGSYDVRRVRYPTPDHDLVPAFLLRPTRGASRTGVVVLHQHNGQWHLGKSEAAGRAGDPLQALGPALAAAGVQVLAPDALGFEDRRHHASGTEPHELDKDDHIKEATYRLVLGDTLARKTLEDAAHAVTMLASQPGIERVGVVGHSFGGHQTLFLAATDPRVAFACASGAAGSFEGRMANRFGIGFDQVVPGIARRMDFPDLVAWIAPRPLLLVAGEDDRYALDARDIAEQGRHAYRRQDADDELECQVLPGEHRLTRERHDLIVDWTLKAARRFG